MAHSLKGTYHLRPFPAETLCDWSFKVSSTVVQVLLRNLFE